MRSVNPIIKTEYPEQCNNTSAIAAWQITRMADSFNASKLKSEFKFTDKNLVTSKSDFDYKNQNHCFT